MYGLFCGLLRHCFRRLKLRALRRRLLFLRNRSIIGDYLHKLLGWNLPGQPRVDKLLELP